MPLNMRATPNRSLIALDRGRMNGSTQSRGVSCAWCRTPVTSSCSSLIRSSSESGGCTNSGAARSFSRGARRRRGTSQATTVSVGPPARSIAARAATLSARSNGMAASARKPCVVRSKWSGSPASSPCTAVTLSPVGAESSSTTTDPSSGARGRHVRRGGPAALCADALATPRNATRATTDTTTPRRTTTIAVTSSNAAMIPSASMSSSTVPKMNQKVARRTAGRRGLEPPDEPGDGGAATLLQVPLERVAQRLRLHVGVVVVHEVQYGAEHAGRPLLVAHTELAGRHRRRHLIATHGGRVTPQALVTILSERRARAGAQREHLGEIALHHAERVRSLHVEALRLVLLRYGGAGIQRLARLQVRAVVAAMRAVHDQVLHEDAVDAGILLHGTRQAVAIVQRVEQLVVSHGHDGMSQAVPAVEVLERPGFFPGM